jgi:hypothetical protein
MTMNGHFTSTGALGTLAALLLAVGLPAVAADSGRSPPLSAAQIVDRNVAARGGLAAWRAVQSMSWQGTLGAGASSYEVVTPAHKLQRKERDEVRLPFTLEYRRPASMRLELAFGGQTAVQVFDGARGWKYRPFLGRMDWEAYTPEEARQAAAQPGFEGYLIDHAARGARVELVGTEAIEGHNAYKLGVTLRDGRTRHVWVDAQSFLDVQVEGEPRRLDGRLHAVVIHLRDFRPEHGLVIPHVQETQVLGVPRTEKILIESIAVNPALDDGRFTRS